MLRFLPWLTGLCLILSGFFIAPKPAKDFPEPVIEGDTAVFRQLHTAWMRQVMDISPEKCYVHTDRTMYSPGDTLWFNAFIVNAGDLMPSVRSQVVYASLYDPRGTPVQQLRLSAPEGTAAGEFVFSPDLPGGRYQLVAHTNWMCNDSSSFFKRDIVLQKTVTPRINLKMEFERKAVGPGDEVTARFDAATLENQSIANQTLTWSVAIAGKNYSTGTAATDAAGRAYLKFKLPATLDSPDGLLNVQIEHQGRSEAISRPIPIVLNKIDLQFFPEGGDMIAGLPCQMAFKAANEFGKAADVEGFVADDQGRRIAEFSSFHNGVGSFLFSPQPGKRYTAQLTQPVTANYALPISMKTGATLQLENRNERFLTFYAGTAQPGKFFLTATARDKIFFFKEINIQGNSEKIVVPIADIPIGIAHFTLMDANKHEMAERLVFLHRNRGLNITVEPNQEHYSPREPVRLRLRVRDDAGRPVQGRFSVSVSDEALLTYADDKQGHLMSALLLEQDLKGEVEEPNFYFDVQEPKSEAALDYLLLTQGWRRFQWKEVLKPLLPEVLTFKNERNDLYGVLLNFADYKPLKGHRIVLMPDNIVCMTDTAGQFLFHNIDWAQPKHIVDQLNISRQIAYTNAAVYLVEGKSYMPTDYVAGKNVLTGQVIDAETGETIIGATVKVTKNGEFIRGAITDVDGQYRVPLPAGKFDVQVGYTGYTENKISGIRVNAGRGNICNVTMSGGAILNEVVVTSYKVPLIQQDAVGSGQVIAMGSRGGGGGEPLFKKRKNTAAMAPAPEMKAAEIAKLGQNATQAGQTLTADQIKTLPTRSIAQIVASTAGNTTIEGGDILIKGTRATTNYYIDGIRVVGQPVQEKEEEIPGGGIPADIGNKDNLAEPMKIMEEMDVMNRREMAKPMAKAKRAMDTIFEDDGGLQPKQLVRTFHRARQFYVPKYRRNDALPAQRNDFRPTIYWNPTVVTDAFGEAVLDFVTSDAITNFRVTVEGISLNGQPGRTEHKIFTEKTLSVEVKTPPYIISGDTLRLEALVVNKTGRNLSGSLTAQVPGHFQLIRTENKGRTFVYRIGMAGSNPTQAVVVAWREGNAVLDEMKVNIPTLDRGFPIRQVLSGQSAQNAYAVQLMQPIEGTIEATLTAYPGALEEVLKGTERMLRQPGGCFEQVSSSNYPNLLVLDLLRRANRIEPEIEKRAQQYLQSGYQQLTAYECKNGGFDWWGRDPGHEGLTAYGLLEFKDMQRVFPVDQTVIDRTAKWLLSRRDSQGGWKINPQSLHGWQNDGVLEAYIAWTVAAAGYSRDFSTEINKAAETAWKSNDPYQMALLTNALLASNDPRAARFLTRLLELQQPDGSWKGKTHSVLHAYGPCFDVETTALGALALLQNKGHQDALAPAMEFITKSKTEYGYGSTQSTVLALKALSEYAGSSNMAQAADGMMVVQVDGKRVQELPVSVKALKRLEVKHLEQYFTNDHPRIEVFFEKGKVVLPFDIEIKYASLQPRNTAQCALALQTDLSKSTVKKGETVRLSALITNNTNQPAAYPMLVVGIPAGLSLQPWQLKKLMDEHRCDFYELWDGKAVFHFEQLPANAARNIDLDLRADIAGTFEAPASQAFLYYQNDQRVWSKPNRLTVMARE